MALSSPGIGSNLDVNSIIKQLMAVESQPLTALAKKEAGFQAKLAAYGNVSGALGAFQSAVNGLSTPAKFQALTATSADSSIVTASASGQAVPGNYNINVSTLAQSQTIKTAAQATTSATIGSGATTTLTFQFGTIAGGTSTGGVYDGATFTQDPTRGTGSVTIDSSNNSLQGIRDAVNKANIGVTATIVSDGSATPNYLVFTSTKTGLTSSMKISATGDSALQDLLSYNPADGSGQKMTETTVAQNTVLTVNGITINSATKTVADAIQGVTLNVSKAGSTTLAINRDTAGVTSAVNGFVKAYNDINNTLKKLTAYNPATKEAGLLLGDPTVRTVQNSIRQMLSTAVSDSGGAFRTLSDVGVSFQKDGSLAVDSAKLQNAINTSVADVGALFAAVGTSTDSLTSVIGSSAATKPGKYAVNLTALATQGSFVGNLNLNPGPTVIADGTSLNITLDGTTASVALAGGSYSSAQLAAMLQSAVNGTAAFGAAGSSVTANVDSGGFLSIASARFGSASSVSISSGTGTDVATLFGNLPVATTGQNVAGTIDGSLASGSGQTLTAATGVASEGLKLQITGGAIGNRGTVNFSRGFADQLSKLVDTFLGSSGLISGRTSGISNSIKDIDRSRETINTRLAETERRYRAQFLALDTAISSMSTTSNFLQQQLANLPKVE
ncbi:MAG TPA: flagellar filament capping protein FliD [Noviherbaspirillum sp.]|uniref:flagellar filament capping protein FliD n=1 Tax=Noviherbaspirillum sp. TaxID=1926288 RepID=UPI002DDCF5BF|nr:flagellar filament capping protein FliD [Noviherbaspirillum sp.]HEV2608670.1 flagellar filament capping protein FliD [Noviherbaspirillum sp.]